MTDDSENQMDHSAEIKASVADVFGRAAATYDRVGPRYFTYFGKKLVEFADIREGDRVLDVATGRGSSLFPAAEKVGANGEVIGIDLTAEMAANTNRDIEVRRIANARVMQMDAEDLRFPDGSFDRVLCGFALFFMPDPNRALREFLRVLKPGGVVAVSTWGEDDGRWAWDREIQKKYIPPRPPHMDPRGLPKIDFDKPEGMDSLLSEAGLVDVRADIEAREFVYKDEDDWWATRWSHFSRYDLERMTQKNLERYRAEAFEKLKQMKGPDGIPTIDRALFTRGARPVVSV